jgi:hypothetical protein
MMKNIVFSNLIKIFKFLLIFILFPLISIKICPFIDNILINYCDFDLSNFYHKNNNDDLNLSSSSPSSTMSSNNSLLLVEKSTENNEEYYKVKINKQVVDSVSNTIIEGAKIGIKTALPNTASVTAGGAVGATALKVSSGLPLPSRLAFVGLSTAVAAAGAKLGLSAADGLTNNADKIKEIVENNIKNSKHSNIDIGRIPSPDIDDSFIFSVLEKNDIISESSPIEILLTSIFGFNVLILILNIIILINIFNRYVVKFNLELVSYLVDKYVPLNYRDRIKNYLTKGTNYNNNFLFYFFIFNCIILIIFLIINIYLSAELLVRIDEYCKIYIEFYSKK